MKYLIESRKDILDYLEHFMDLPTKFSYCEVDLTVFDSGQTKNGIDAENTDELGFEVLSILDEVRNPIEGKYRYRKTSWDVKISKGIVKICFKYDAKQP